MFLFSAGKETSLDFLDDDMPRQKKGTGKQENKQKFQ